MTTKVRAATVLCVDDETSGLYFRRLILEQHGFRVLTAVSVESALRQFIANHVDLVIADQILKRDTGTRMACEMKRLRPDVNIILLSGSTDMPDDSSCVDAFLCKTEGPEALLRQADELLASKDFSSEWPPPALLVNPPQNSGESDSLRTLLAAIVENSDDAILSKTLDGTVTSWNRAAERMYGYTAAEMIGRPIALLLPPDRPNEVWEILKRLRRGERIDHFETARMAKDGRRLEVSLCISPICDKQGKIVGASTIARDITHLKMAEQALRNSEKLAVAGRMAATVAHEINNPLEALSNILYLLAQNKSLNDEGRNYLQVAEDELRRITQITRLTLGFHREKQSTPSPVSIADLIDNVLALYNSKTASLRIRVVKQYEDAGVVEGVAGELRQVFSNLIVNAVDALSESGDCLTIRVKESGAWCNPKLRGVRVTVADNGSGIVAESKQHIFDAFFTTKGDKGTGIGLWVSRGIIKRHGGSIRLRSKVGGNRGGTTFSIFLPFQTPAVEQMPIAISA